MESLDWPHFIAILLSGLTALFGGLWYALKVIALWLKPWIEKILNSWLKFIEKLTTQHLVLEQFASSLNVLTQMLSSQQSAIKQGKYIILAIDDNPIDQKIIASAVMQLMAEYPSWREFQFKEVGTLGEAYQYIPFTRLIILDQYLPDAELEQVQAFSRFASHCHVILYTGGEVDEGKYKSVSATVRKDKGAIVLKEAIREVISGDCQI